MKKIALGLLGLLSAAGIVYAADVELSGSRVTSFANVNDTSNATFDVVAAVTGKIVRLHDLLISVETADTVTVKCGSNTKIGPIYLGATSGLSKMFYPLRIKCAASEALKITKGTASTKVTALAAYTQE